MVTEVGQWRTFPVDAELDKEQAFMTVKTCDVQEFQKYLEYWSGGAVSLNSYRDDHDRLILRLEHPTASEGPVGLSLFYCTYLAGPVRWEQSALTIQTCSRQ